MTTQTITARVDSKVVEAAKKIAQMNWISLSSIINIKLREFINNKELTLSSDECHFYFWEEGIDPKVILDHFEK